MLRVPAERLLWAWRIYLRELLSCPLRLLCPTIFSEDGPGLNSWYECVPQVKGINHWQSGPVVHYLRTKRSWNQVVSSWEVGVEVVRYLTLVLHHPGWFLVQDLKGFNQGLFGDWTGIDRPLNAERMFDVENARPLAHTQAQSHSAFWSREIWVWIIQCSSSVMYCFIGEKMEISSGWVSWEVVCGGRTIRIMLWNVQWTIKSGVLCPSHSFLFKCLAPSSDVTTVAHL